MESIKYVVERQMIYSLDERSPIDTIAECDNFVDALDELEKAAQSYANDKNVAIAIFKYEFDEENQEYKYVDILLGFYGTETAKHLKIASTKKKYGLIIA